MIVFLDSAFKHGYEKEDFYEVLASKRVKIRSRRGLANVYELYGRNHAGDYLHLAYRRQGGQTVVFHMRQMSPREKQMYRRHR